MWAKSAAFCSPCRRSPDDREHTLRKMVGAGLAPEIWQQWVSRFGEFQIFEGWGSTEANTNTINVDNWMGSCGRVPFWEKTNLRLVRYDIEPDSTRVTKTAFCSYAMWTKWAKASA